MIGRSRIAELIPHAGAMCLLDRAIHWDAEGIRCIATSHRDPGNPLRRQGRLNAVCSVEYAAQAMALHGALTAHEGRTPRGGLLASVRDMVLHRAELQDCGDELVIEARRLMGEATRVIYEFSVYESSLGDAGSAIASGRAAVLLDLGPDKRPAW